MNYLLGHIKLVHSVITFRNTPIDRTCAILVRVRIPIEPSNIERKMIRSMNIKTAVTVSHHNSMIILKNWRQQFLDVSLHFRGDNFNGQKFGSFPHWRYEDVPCPSPTPLTAASGDGVEIQRF